MFATEGWDLILTARREGPLQALADELAASGATVTVLPEDLADPEAPGGDTLYGPIKSFLIKASQGLHLELRGTGVHVTALCPGYTLTEFHDANGTRAEVSAAYPGWMWQAADHVARVGHAACEANRPAVTPGVMNNLLAGLAKHLPDRMALAMVGGHAKRLKRI